MHRHGVIGLSPCKESSVGTAEDRAGDDEVLMEKDVKHANFGCQPRKKSFSPQRSSRTKVFFLCEFYHWPTQEVQFRSIGYVAFSLALIQLYRNSLSSRLLLGRAHNLLLSHLPGARQARETSLVTRMDLRGWLRRGFER
jgi:hypothetical protein